MPVFSFKSDVYVGEYIHEAPLDAATLASWASIRSWISENRAIPSLGRHQLARQ